MNKKQQFIEKSLEKFDSPKHTDFPSKEFNGLDESGIYGLKHLKDRDFLQSALSECWDMAGEEIREKINKSDIKLWEPEDQAYILEVISKK